MCSRPVPGGAAVTSSTRCGSLAEGGVASCGLASGVDAARAGIGSSGSAALDRRVRRNSVVADSLASWPGPDIGRVNLLSLSGG
jgi:hypothetical protein